MRFGIWQCCPVELIDWVEVDMHKTIDKCVDKDGKVSWIFWGVNVAFQVRPPHRDRRHLRAGLLREVDGRESLLDVSILDLLSPEATMNILEGVVAQGPSNGVVCDKACSCIPAKISVGGKVGEVLLITLITVTLIMEAEMQLCKPL
jgi:hypothetical protein